MGGPRAHKEEGQDHPQGLEPFFADIFRAIRVFRVFRALRFWTLRAIWALGVFYSPVVVHSWVGFLYLPRGKINV